MNRIKTEVLKAGMRFTKAVYIDGDTILVEPHLSLKQAEIDRLKKWKVKEVHTDGKLLAETKEEDEAVLKRQGYRISNVEGLRLYESSVKSASEVFAGIGRGVKFDHDRIDDIAARLLKAIESDQDNISQLVLLTAEGSNLAQSSVKNAILTSIIGKTLKLYGFRLVQLTKGALLHDIGMIKIPQAIRAKKGKLTPQELKIVKTHPYQGYNIVLKEMKYPEEVARIVLHHQERWDGTGYPKGLKKDAIPLGARIVAVTDAFEAMVNSRAYRSAIIGYRAMKAILSDNGRHFDPKVLRAPLASLGIYPVGSLVLLNNSCIGKVVKNHPKAPVRPKIQIIVNESGERIAEPRVLDLLEQKNLFIAKAVDPQGVNGTDNG